jgi:hypothetical protein
LNDPRGSHEPASGTLAVGLLFAAAAAVPALVRVSATGGYGLAGLCLWGSVSLVVVPVALWLRRAATNGLARADQALLGGAALSALPLALCGGVLKSTTHHRPLGGATFAVAALCLLALCIGLSFRVLWSESPRATRSAWQNLFLLGCGLSLLCVLLLGAATASRPNLVDSLALLTAGVVASRVKPAGTLARLPLWPMLLGWLVLVGSACLAPKSPQLARSLHTQAQVSFAPLSWLGDGS